MSVNIPRTFVFSDGFKYTNTMLESEMDNLVRTINNANAGLLTWDNVKATTVALTSATVTNLTLTNLSVPLTVANGGTNSATTLNSNRVMVSSSGKIVEAGAITGARIIVSDANGLPAASAVTTTTLGFLDPTSSVQTQLNGKQATLTVGQLPGTATNDDATAGNVGQIVSSTFSAVSFPTSNQRGDLTTITLTAGDWDVDGIAYLIPNSASFSTSPYILVISGESGNAFTNEVVGVNTDYQNGVLPTTFSQATLHCRTRVQSDGTSLFIAGNTTASSQVVRLKLYSGVYTTAVPKASGILRARRVR